jgi:uncharacterized membrane protein YphA (DoxX/SURF4 family)
MMSNWKKTRLVLAWLLAVYLARMFIEMGWVKFDPEGFWTDAFERWGYPVGLRVLVGVLEVGGAVLILVPWVASYGAIALFIVMLGAWMTRFGDGRFVDVAWISGYIVGLGWIAFEWWGKRWIPGGNPGSAKKSPTPE